MVAATRLDSQSVRRAYARWAPVYDMSFANIVEAGRRDAIRIINERSGSLLDVGVGTGIALPDYARHLQITGVDLSPDMLEKARERVAKRALSHIRELREMDAGALEFPRHEGGLGHGVPRRTHPLGLVGRAAAVGHHCQRVPALSRRRVQLGRTAQSSQHGLVRPATGVDAAREHDDSVVLLLRPHKHAPPVPPSQGEAEQASERERAPFHSVGGRALMAIEKYRIRRAL